MKKHMSTILSIVGGIGVVATAISTAKATPKALKAIEAAEEMKGEKLTKLEKVKYAAPSYIPAVLVGTSTIACIFGAHVLNKRHQIALMSAYALLNTSYKEYKNKVKEMLGEDADKEIQGEIVKDNYKEADIQFEDDGKELFYESYSRRYFRATREQMISVQYDLNKIVQEDGGLSLNVYFRMLGLEETDYGEYIGWSAGQLYDSYWTSWVDFEHNKVVMDDGLECWIIDMTEPMEGFGDY